MPKPVNLRPSSHLQNLFLPVEMCINCKKRKNLGQGFPAGGERGKNEVKWTNKRLGNKTTQASQSISLAGGQKFFCMCCFNPSLLWRLLQKLVLSGHKHHSIKSGNG